MEVKIPENFNIEDEIREYIRSFLQERTYTYMIGETDKCTITAHGDIYTPDHYEFFKKFATTCQEILAKGAYREDPWAAIAVPCYLDGYIKRDNITKHMPSTLVYESIVLEEYKRQKEKELCMALLQVNDKRIYKNTREILKSIQYIDQHDKETVNAEYGPGLAKYIKGPCNIITYYSDLDKYNGHLQTINTKAKKTAESPDTLNKDTIRIAK